MIIVVLFNNNRALLFEDVCMINNYDDSEKIELLDNENSIMGVFYKDCVNAILYPRSVDEGKTFCISWCGCP